MTEGFNIFVPLLFARGKYIGFLYNYFPTQKAGKKLHYVYNSTLVGILI